MSNLSKIMRRSAYTFLQSYNTFTTIAALFVLPFSASLLLSHVFISVSSSSQPLLLISSRLNAVFVAAGFPATSKFFTLLNLKLSQTIFTFLVTSPFSLTFLVCAKSAVVKTFCDQPSYKLAPPPLWSLLKLYKPVVLTQIFSIFVIFSANTVVFCLLFLIFNILDILGCSSNISQLIVTVGGAAAYAVVLATVLAVCDLAGIISASEKTGGYLPVLKACEFLMSGRMADALILALPANLGMAAMEALLQFRLIRPYYFENKLNLAFISEFALISYVHSVILVTGMIVYCLFYKRCKSGENCSLVEEGSHYHRIELEPEDKRNRIQP